MFLRFVLVNIICFEWNVYIFCVVIIYFLCFVVVNLIFEIKIVVSLCGSLKDFEEIE